MRKLLPWAAEVGGHGDAHPPLKSVIVCFFLVVFFQVVDYKKQMLVSPTRALCGPWPSAWRAALWRWCTWRPLVTTWTASGSCSERVPDSLMSWSWRGPWPTRWRRLCGRWEDGRMLSWKKIHPIVFEYFPGTKLKPFGERLEFPLQLSKLIKQVASFRVFVWSLDNRCLSVYPSIPLPLVRLSSSLIC